MFAHRLAVGEAFRAGGAHEVRVDGIEEQRALQEVQLGVLGEYEGDRWEDEVFAAVDDRRPEALDVDVARARHQHHRVAGLLIDRDADKHDGEPDDGDGKVDEKDGHSLQDRSGTWYWRIAV